MILNGFCLYNRKTGQYNTPTYVPYSIEQFIEHVECQVKLATGIDATLLNESDVYYVGTFDTKTCEATFSKEFILALGGTSNDKTN